MMPNAHGHSTKRTILYARVSTEEQARSGYSLAQQMEALKEYAVQEGYEIIEEVTDPGQSGASLERPGMDRVRDLVAAGSVSTVLAQDRDRFSREPAYHYLLKKELEEHGCKLRALNDRGDDSPEGELADGIFDQFAKFERAKVAERTRRGKLRRAREGKIIPGRIPNYGFEFNSGRDNYEVDEEAMKVVRRIFELVGTQKSSIHGITTTFEREGVPTPTGKRFWDVRVIRRFIFDDVYKPHTFDEVVKLVRPEVAAQLDPDKCYGIWWFNRRRIRTTQVAESGSNGKQYRKHCTLTLKPKDEWIAVPVPDSRIPRKVVEAAREAIQENRPTSASGERFWELSGGILYCSGCGCRMRAHATSSSPEARVKMRYYYYRCPKARKRGRAACPQGRNVRADKIEPRVWEFVSDLLKSPDKLKAGLDQMIKRQEQSISRGNPEREAKVWIDKIVETEQMRSSYQDLAAKALMTYEELGEKLSLLEETRKTAEMKLVELKEHQQRIQVLKKDKAALLDSFAGSVLQGLDDLSPEKRHEIYKRLRLQVCVGADQSIQVSGAFGDDRTICTSEPTSRHLPWASSVSGRSRNPWPGSSDRRASTSPTS